jgi:hypothetical protein
MFDEAVTGHPGTGPVGGSGSEPAGDVVSDDGAACEAAA